MKRRTLLGALLVGTAGCVDRRPQPSERAAPNETNSSNTTASERVNPIHNESFTIGPSDAPMPESEPEVVVENTTVTVLAAVQIPNHCHELRFGASEYDEESETLVVDVEAEDTSDPEENCPSEISYSSYRYETTVPDVPVRRVELDHPVGGSVYTVDEE